MRKSDKLLQTIHFSAINIQMKVEKAKLRCEIQMTGKNLRQWRREINKIIKSLNEIDKEGKEENEKTTSNSETTNLDSDSSGNA